MAIATFVRIDDRADLFGFVGHKLMRSGVCCSLFPDSFASSLNLGAAWDTGR